MSSDRTETLPTEKNKKNTSDKSVICCLRLKANISAVRNKHIRAILSVSIVCRSEESQDSGIEAD